MNILRLDNPELKNLFKVTDLKISQSNFFTADGHKFYHISNLRDLRKHLNDDNNNNNGRCQPTLGRTRDGIESGAEIKETTNTGGTQYVKNLFPEKKCG